MSRMNENPFADHDPFDDSTSPTSSFHQQAQAQQQAADLERRERDLAARERALNERAEHIRKHGRNNFPPFFPLIYHSIPDEIPEPSRPLITRLFQLWLVLAATLTINLVACIILVVSGQGDGVRDLSGAITYLPIIGVLSFLLWYRPIYNAYMKEQALYYYIYFFFCGWHLLFSIYMIVGIPGTGSAGLISTIIAFQHGAIVSGVFGTLATIGWTLQGVGNAWYYRAIWQHHHDAGHTLEKAKGELAANGAKSYFSRG